MISVDLPAGPLTRRQVEALPRGRAEAIQRFLIDEALRLVYVSDLLELRVMKACEPDLSPPWSNPHVVSGYFDRAHLDALADAAVRAQRAPRSAKGVYLTLNELAPELLGRRANRAGGVRKKEGESTTHDNEVTRLRRFLVDLDPRRPTGIGSTDAQHAAAHLVAGAVRRALDELGFPAPVHADSGNGAHLLYAIDLEPEHAPTIKRALQAIAARFPRESTGIAVDTSIYNPARICKLYGTWSCKGDDTELTPHRLSRIVEAPAGGLELLDLALLEELAAHAPEDEPPSRAVAGARPGGSKPAPDGQRPRSGDARALAGWRAGRWSLEAWASDVNLPLDEPKAWHSSSGEGVTYPFKHCHCGRGVDGSALCVAGDGAISHVCHHNDCGLPTWSAFRDAFEPGYRQRRDDDLARVAEAKKKRAAAQGAEMRDSGGASNTVGKQETPPPPASPPPPAGGDDEPEEPAPDWTDRLLINRYGTPKNMVRNVLLILAHDEDWRGILRFNALSHRVELAAKPPFDAIEAGADLVDDEHARRRYPAHWTDSDTTALQSWIAGAYRFEPGVERTHQCVVRAAESHAYHPVRAYLTALEWDGVDRLATFLRDSIGAEENLYSASAFTWWAISAVDRAMNPGCQADHTLVLEGPQGWGKSSLLRALCVDPAWFADTKLDVGHKDALQALDGKWLVELAELAAISKRDVESVKNFLTSRSDTYRPAYGRVAVDRPRQVAFAGSTNRTEGYLSDDTGNRRFLPVRAARPVVVRDVLAVRDQIWAEAFARWRKGEPSYPHTDELRELCREEQDARMITDVWETAVCLWLKGRTGWISNAEILERALDISPRDQDRARSNRVAAIMSNLDGWRSVRRRKDGAVARGWERVSALDPSELDSPL